MSPTELTLWSLQTGKGIHSGKGIRGKGIHSGKGKSLTTSGGEKGGVKGAHENIKGGGKCAYRTVLTITLEQYCVLTDIVRGAIAELDPGFSELLEWFDHAYWQSFFFAIP